MSFYSAKKIWWMVAAVLLPSVIEEFIGGQLDFSGFLVEGAKVDVDKDNFINVVNALNLSYAPALDMGDVVKEMKSVVQGCIAYNEDSKIFFCRVSPLLSLEAFLQMALENIDKSQPLTPSLVKDTIASYAPNTFTVPISLQKIVDYCNQQISNSFSLSSMPSNMLRDIYFYCGNELLEEFVKRLFQMLHKTLTNNDLPTSTSASDCLVEITKNQIITFFPTLAQHFADAFYASKSGVSNQGLISLHSFNQQVKNLPFFADPKHAVWFQACQLSFPRLRTCSDLYVLFTHFGSTIPDKDKLFQEQFPHYYAKCSQLAIEPEEIFSNLIYNANNASFVPLSDEEFKTLLEKVFPSIYKTVVSDFTVAEIVPFNPKQLNFVSNPTIAVPQPVLDNCKTCVQKLATMTVTSRNDLLAKFFIEFDKLTLPGAPPASQFPANVPSSSSGGGGKDFGMFSDGEMIVSEATGRSWIKWLPLIVVPVGIGVSALFIFFLIYFYRSVSGQRVVKSPNAVTPKAVTAA